MLATEILPGISWELQEPDDQPGVHLFPNRRLDNLHVEFTGLKWGVLELLWKCLKWYKSITTYRSFIFYDFHWSSTRLSVCHLLAGLRAKDYALAESWPEEARRGNGKRLDYNSIGIVFHLVLFDNRYVNKTCTCYYHQRLSRRNFKWRRYRQQSVERY